MSSCGCNNPSATGPLLSGNLDPAFAPPSSTSDESLLDAATIMGAKPFSLAWFVEAALVGAFIVGAAYVIDKTYKEHSE